jgi:hypothetical protein
VYGESDGLGGVQNTGVGIGTTSPTARLAITGLAGNRDIFTVASSSNARLFTITSSGGVGIGTSTPQAKMVVAGGTGITTSSYVSINPSGDGTNRTLTIDGNSLQVSNSNAPGNTNALSINPLGGNVGIGTTTPVVRLQVAADGSSPGVDTQAQLVISGAANASKRLSIGFDTGGNYGWLQAGISGTGWNDISLNSRGGNVGIGTTTPGAPLEVVATGGTLQRWSRTGTGSAEINFANADSKLILYGGNGTYSGTPYSMSFDSSADSLIFGRTSVDATTNSMMTITNAGNVGIGTTSPLSRFHIMSTSAGAETTPLILNNFSTLANTAIRTIWALTDNIANNTNGRMDQLAARQSDGSVDYSVLLSPGSSGVPASRFMIDGSSGNVGIGTVSPDNRLTLQAASAGGTGYIGWNKASNSASFVGIGYDETLDALKFSASVGVANFNNDWMVINRSTGHVGIGTTTPYGLLSIGRSSSLSTGHVVMTTSGTSGYGPTIYLDASSITNGRQFAIGSGGNLDAQGVGKFVIYDVTAGANRFIIDSSGNIGIGTTTPSAQLTTTGTVRLANFGAGNLQTDALGNVSVSSDERLKDIEGSFSRGLAELRTIQPIVYKWNAASGLDMSGTYAGFSAQNVDGSIPEAVGKSPNGYLSLSDRPILAATVNAIKELDLVLASTTARISAVEGRLASIESLIANGGLSLGAGTTTAVGASTTASTTISAVSGWLSSLGATIENAFARFVAIAADFMQVKRLTVGDEQNLAAAGVTIFDRATGQPVCMYVENGSVKSEAGACGGQAGGGTGGEEPSDEPADEPGEPGDQGGEPEQGGAATTTPFTVSLAPDPATSEGGGTVSFTVVLDAQPTGDVTIPVSVDDAGEAMVDKTSLIFRRDGPTAWDIPQTVTVTGVDDEDVDGSQPFTLTVGDQGFALINHDNEDAASTTESN